MQQNQVGSPDGSGDQLSQAPSTPQAQVTVVGGTLSQSDGAVADAPASDDGPVAVAENGAAQEDGEAEFGVMSTGDQEQESVDSAEQPVAAEEVKPEAGAAAEQVARTESSPASAPGTSGETQQSWQRKRGRLQSVSTYCLQVRTHPPCPGGHSLLAVQPHQIPGQPCLNYRRLRPTFGRLNLC